MDAQAAAAIGENAGGITGSDEAFSEIPLQHPEVSP
jgi:hypothetical protein